MVYGSASPVASLAAFCADAAAEGWHERNGGNVSVRLDEMQAEAACAELGGTVPMRSFDLAWPVPLLADAWFLVTASGCFMRFVADALTETIGLIRIADDGASYSIAAGFAGGGKPTSELPSHLLVHQERSRALGAKEPGAVNHVVYHAHTPALIALSHCLPAESGAFTRTLWSTFTECPMFCPEGVGVVGFEIPGSIELARKTAELARVHAAVMWALHGVLACGDSLGEVLGLVETLEKAADIALRSGAAAGGAIGSAAEADGGFSRGRMGCVNALGPVELEALDDALGLGLNRSLLRA